MTMIYTTVNQHTLLICAKIFYGNVWFKFPFLNKYFKREENSRELSY